jgi:hypothetical protein
MTALHKTTDARANLQQQFDFRKCKGTSEESILADEPNSGHLRDIARRIGRHRNLLCWARFPLGLFRRTQSELKLIYSFPLVLPGDRCQVMVRGRHCGSRRFHDPGDNKVPRLREAKVTWDYSEIRTCFVFLLVEGFE